MPEPAKLLSVPPVAATSAEVKVMEASERVKVIVAVSPALRALTLLEMATVGRMVSTVRVTVLLASAPSLLVLPAASLKVPDATEITPLVVLFAVGVKVAL